MERIGTSMSEDGHENNDQGPPVEQHENEVDPNVEMNEEDEDGSLNQNIRGVSEENQGNGETQLIKENEDGQLNPNESDVPLKQNDGDAKLKQSDKEEHESGSICYPYGDDEYHNRKATPKKLTFEESSTQGSNSESSAFRPNKKVRPRNSNKDLRRRQ